MSILHLLDRNRRLREGGASPSEEEEGLSEVIEQNIGKLGELRRRDEQQKTLQDRIADWITRFSGSMAFLYVHAAWFGAWVLINLGLTPFPRFDPYPFNFLTMVVSLEAIFLSTFVLISQNKMSASADRRADLDLQINLLAEYEITRILRLVDAMAERMKIDEAGDPDVQELKSKVAPEAVLKQIEIQETEGTGE